MRPAPFAPFRDRVDGLEERSSTFPNDPLATARTYANSLARTAALARAFTTSGRTVDLTGLDDKVGLLCAKALDLPPQAGREFRAELILLRSELNSLALALGQPPPAD
jgi:hypothetical protein